MSRTRPVFIEGFTAVELTRRRDVDVDSPLAELLVGHGPARVRLVGLALVKSTRLLGWELERARADLDQPSFITS